MKTSPNDATSKVNETTPPPGQSGDNAAATDEALVNIISPPASIPTNDAPSHPLEMITTAATSTHQSRPTTRSQQDALNAFLSASHDRQSLRQERWKELVRTMKRGEDTSPPTPSVCLGARQAVSPKEPTDDQPSLPPRLENVTSDDAPIPLAQRASLFEDEEDQDKKAASKKMSGKPDVLDDDDAAPMPDEYLVAAALEGDDNADKKPAASKQRVELSHDDDAPVPLHHTNDALIEKTEAKIKSFDDERKPAAAVSSGLASGDPSLNVFISDDANLIEQSDGRITAAAVSPSSELDTLMPPPPPATTHQPQPYARPPPPPIQQSQANFYAVEATLVEESSEPQRSQPELVYDAEIVTEEPPLPWWKRVPKKVVAGLILIIVALVAGLASFATRNRPSTSSPRPSFSPTTPSPTTTQLPTASSQPSQSINPTLTPLPTTANPATEHPTTSNQPTFSCVTRKQTIFETDCDDCYPTVGIDGDTAVVTKDYESIQFLSKNADGRFESTTNIEIGDVYDIAIARNYTVVGSRLGRLEDDYTGAAYMYEKDSSGEWGHLTRIVPSNISQGAYFGLSVDVDGDIMVVGALDNRLGAEGSAFVYQRSETGWVEEATLAPEDLSLEKFVGIVSVKGDLIAVGDHAYGAVFLYQYNSSVNLWSQINGPLINDDCDGEFGSEVVLTEDDGLMIGCPGENYYTGGTYFYEKSDGGDEFIFRQKLTASDGAPNDLFGSWAKIAVDGNVAVIGTWIETNGKAYIFRRENDVWTEVAIIYAPPGSTYFGYLVAISGNDVLIASATNAYLYSLDEC